MNLKPPKSGAATEIFYPLVVVCFLLAIPFSCDPLAERPPASFVAFGDWGTGSIDQLLVAHRVRNFCEVNPCDFLVTLGDNFYDYGVSGTDDPQWEKKFKRFYGRMKLPFYAAVGSHDMGGDVAAQIEYSNRNDFWRMPGEEYVISRTDQHHDPLIDLFIINSSNFDAGAAQWLESSLSSSEAPWKFLVMNFPLISNGTHGDDDGEIADRLLPIICNRVQLILSGHDHLFSHLREEIGGCGVEQIILGTGGANLHEPDESDPRVLKTGSFHGFGYFSIWPERVVMEVETSDRDTFYQTEWTR